MHRNRWLQVTVDEHGGRHVHAHSRIEPGEVVFMLPKVFSATRDRHSIEVGPDRHQAHTGDIDDYINHSCDPNLELVVLDADADEYGFRSLRPIEPGEEVSWDYETFESRLTAPFPCHCGAENCRKWIRGREVPRSGSPRPKTANGVSEDRILTIPNLVTLVRLAGVGVFWWVLLGVENVAAAAWLVFVVGWTDWVDGYLARRLDQVSRLGKALDPVADRLMIASAVIGGLIAGVVPPGIAAPLLAREAITATVAATLLVRGHGVLEVRYVGKVATFLLYGSIPAFYLAAADILPRLMSPLGWGLGILGLGLYWYSLGLYLGDAGRAIRRVKSPTPEKNTG